MAEDIVDKYAWIGPAYKVALYDEVVREFTPTQTRPLPDLAALTKGEKALPDPQTFVDHTKALPAPEEEFDPKAWEMTDYTLDDARKKELFRLSGKYDLTPLESWWKHCMETTRVYEPMPAGWKGTGMYAD